MKPTALTPMLALVVGRLALLGPASQALAQWSNDPMVNTPISTAAGFQRAPTIASDGDGGAVIAWHDFRSGLADDIFAQRIDRLGVVQWTGDGVGVSVATGDQFNPVSVRDGAGGAIIAWVDERSGSDSDIYAQRMTADGDSVWAGDGIPVSAAIGSQFHPVITSDGMGGAIIAWIDSRNGNDDIFARRVAADGTLLWDDGGVPLCVEANFQTAPAIAGDGAGGAVIAWHDFRSGADNDIFAQRVNAAGSVQWPENGVGVCTFGGSQEFPALVGDGTGGALIAWEDYRFGPLDIFARRVDGSGAPQWMENGVAISLAGGDQQYVSMVSDRAQGAIITWEDRRNGPAPDIFAQRIDLAGEVQWMPNGVSVCTFSGHQRVPISIQDGAGGAIVTWFDSRSGTSFDIFAQRIAGTGGSQWPANGVAICTAAGNQFAPVLVGDGAGGAVLAWEDFRNGAHWDVFAQQVDGSGALGNPVTAVSPPEGSASASASLLVLQANRPNPFAGITTIPYELATGAHVRIRILDVLGREVARLADETQAAGRRSILFDARRLPAGLYLCELTAGDRVETRRMLVAR